MEVRYAPVLLFACLGLLALVQVYRALPWDLRCNHLSAGDPWRVEEASRISRINSNESSSSLTIPQHSRGDGPGKSIAQILQEKVAKGRLSSDEDLSKELAGLGFSTRELLAEVFKTMISEYGGAAGADRKEQWGLLHSNYGVIRVVKRLVICSAYRTSLREFTMVTLSPDFTMPTSNPDFRNVPPKDPAAKRTCTWLVDGSAGAPLFRSALEMDETGRSSVGNGVAKFRWIGENHGTSYDVLLIHCTFPEPVGKDLMGGFLYLNITYGSSPDSSLTELAPVFREEPKTLNASLYEFPRKFQYEFAYCSGPVFTNLTAVHVKQFLMYHYALLNGSVHFFIYDSHGIEDETMAVLQPLIDAGSLTVVDFRKEREYDTWYHSQDLAINDCLYRARVLANWVLSWDMDEYLHVHPPLTLPALLELHKDVPWISFGKVDFALHHCAPEKISHGSTQWAVERLLYRPRRPTCGEMCDAEKGARKWMANPRKVRAGKIHAVADLSVKGGVVLSTRAALMYHYRGLVSPRGRFICQQVHDPANSSTFVEGRTVLESDLELASLVDSTLKREAEAVQMFKVGGF